LAVASVSFIPFTAEELWRIIKLPSNVHEQEWNKTLNPVQADHQLDKVKSLFRKEVRSDKLGKMLEEVREKLYKTD